VQGSGVPIRAPVHNPLSLQRICSPAAKSTSKVISGGADHVDFFQLAHTRRSTPTASSETGAAGMWEISESNGFSEKSKENTAERPIQVVAIMAILRRWCVAAAVGGRSSMQANSRIARRSVLRGAAALALMAAGLGSLTGCQVDIGGQTLPSAHYLDDDVQYFRPGPEFMLSNEAAALDEYERTQQTLQQ
jgi:hypothetical protein